MFRSQTHSRASDGGGAAWNGASTAQAQQLLGHRAQATTARAEPRLQRALIPPLSSRGRAAVLSSACAWISAPPFPSQGA